MYTVCTHGSWCLEGHSPLPTSASAISPLRLNSDMILHLPVSLHWHSDMFNCPSSLSMILLHHAVFLDLRLSLMSLRASWFWILSAQATSGAQEMHHQCWLTGGVASSFKRRRFMAKMNILKTNQIYVLVLNNLCCICNELMLIHILYFKKDI